MEKGGKYVSIEWSGSALKSYAEEIFTQTGYKNLPEEEKAMLSAQEHAVFNLAYMRHGALMWAPTVLSNENAIILQRFAKVFEQSYTRFLDLKNAEAQAREATIEAALEKIRSRSLAMQRSDELKEVVAVLFDKLKELGLVFDGGAGIHLFTENSRDAEIWVRSPEVVDPICSKLPNDEDFANNPIIIDVWKAKDMGEDIVNKTYSFQEKNNYFDYVFKHNDTSVLPEPVRKFIKNTESYTATFISEKNSLLGANSWTRQLFSESDIAVFKRVAKVFEQAYVRFLDLQRAEAQAREAQIQLALERVRARTMAMQKSDELTDVAAVLFQQVSDLGIKAWTTGFNVWSDDNNSYTDYITSPQGGFIEPYTVDATRFPAFSEISDARKRGEGFYVSYLEGEMLKQTYLELAKFGDKNQYEKMLEGGFQFPDRQFNHFVFGAKVSLMFITYNPMSEAYEIFKRFGDVFEQAYIRFLDLQKAEAQAIRAAQDLIEIKAARKKAEDALVALKATQQQLIQQEKMASLGELTAGIAHEIQNPLNFVNNFSETNTELLCELKQEAQAGNTTAVIAFVETLEQNQNKITHHGKRADSIVKGMLQHARASTSKKEPADINKLTNEHLRLSYQRMQAKDSTFCATLEKQFDDGIGEIVVMPQEVGRVLLNLFNNAFYAVHEKKRQCSGTFEPKVTVSTKREGDRVFIIVSDNGTGMPEQVKEKIFQPFFTTKPTGEGTALGLSLSYDIIAKGHGGTLTVRSTEGEGTEFVIELRER